MFYDSGSSDLYAYRLGPADMLKYFILSFVDPPIPAETLEPPEDCQERRLDIFEKMVPHPAATYVWEAQGESMANARIYSGDFMVVDCAAVPTLGKIVVATLGNGNTVKRLAIKDNRGYLLPEDPSYQPIPVDEEEGVRVVGVVTWVFHPVA